MATKRRASTPSQEQDWQLAGTTSAARTHVWPQARPAVKRKKTANKDDQVEPEPEKRLRVYKKACPKATLERADRVFAQRFFCVDRKRTSPTAEHFSVLGSTGNLYTVKIQNLPSCDCPDGAKGNHCKHLLFVFLKVLGVPTHSNLWYQSALLTSELEAIFALARPAPCNVLEDRVKTAFEIATGKKKVDTSTDAGGGDGLVKKRIPQEGDSCPICYEDFEAGKKTGLIFCLSISGCGNALHRECFQNWAKTSKPTTCPLCRETWSSTSAAADSSSANALAGPSFSADGYQNFAAQAGLSTVRDTTSYYHGPRRGESYRSGGGRRKRYEDDGYW
ncbi:hypothetical protein BMF94_2305 [Rhodotorula taiwanensis]|uniref:Uncharacterized protein n=1 Tax=Rhodotorula taiwanensis TaxID=741276 RepID=A0A2S5BCP4_9BASI|nr:hypothetical protein BMF94_2305 [Rhodotorula taiwanensis]